MRFERHNTGCQGAARVLEVEQQDEEGAPLVITERPAGGPQRQVTICPGGALVCREWAWSSGPRFIGWQATETMTWRGASSDETTPLPAKYARLIIAAMLRDMTTVEEKR